MDKYTEPSNRRKKKAYVEFPSKTVNSALAIISCCYKDIIECEFIDDYDNEQLKDCLIFLLEGQRP